VHQFLDVFVRFGLVVARGVGAVAVPGVAGLALSVALAVLTLIGAGGIF
jgi:hypothetical protein